MLRDQCLAAESDFKSYIEFVINAVSIILIGTQSEDAPHSFPQIKSWLSGIVEIDGNHEIND